jgi:hypothetical protein
MVDKNLPADDARETLRRLCSEQGVDYASLSRLIGRNPAYIQQFIRRGTPRRLPERERRLIAGRLGVPEHLLGGEAGLAATAGMVAVPLAGGGGGTQSAPLAFSQALLEALAPGGAGQLVLVEVEGDAMAPTFAPGDHLLVDRADSSERLRDGLYVLEAEGGLQVRRLALHPVRRRVTVLCDNPAYADWPDLAVGEIIPFGRIVWAGRRLG